MKKIFTSILILLVLTILVIGIIYIKNKSTNINTQTGSSLNNDVGMLPSEVVEKYMELTLGTIPNASVDYDKAKKYLTDDLKTQFDSPMFVPTSYCIQDGPDAVRIVSDESTVSAVVVVVEGQYAGQWGKMWQFLLIPDGNVSWLINEINCLNL